MVTKLSGFGQYLGRNLMNVENLYFGHGIVLFWYWEPFLGPKIRTSLTLQQFYTDIWNCPLVCCLVMSWFADIWAWACSDFHFGKIFHFFWYWTNLSAPKALVKCCNLFFETLHTCTFVMCSSDLCKKNCVFGHCLKLHAYFELCTSHHIWEK